MADDTKSLVEKIYAAWKARDLTNVVARFSDDMMSALHIPADVMPLGGETKGAVAAALQGLIHLHDFLVYEPGLVTVDSVKANAEVHFRYGIGELGM